MTLLEGEKKTVETFAQFEEEYGVTIDEIRALFTDEKVEEILEFEGEESIDDVSDEDIRTWFEYEYFTQEAIIEILSMRDQKYMHMYEDGFHTITEVY